LALELEREGHKPFNELSERTEMERHHPELLDGCIASLGKSEHFDAGQWRSSHAA